MRSRDYSRTAVTERIPELTAIADEVLLTWSAGDEVELVPALERIVGEQLGRLLVNRSPGDDLPTISKYLHTLVATALFRTRPPSALAEPQFVSARDRVFALADEIIAEHHTANGRQPDLLDDTLTAVGQDPVEFTAADVRQSALSPLLAGLETVVSRGSFMIARVFGEPELRDRVVAEADAGFADGELGWDRLRKLPAIHGAALESLRAYPALLMLPYTVVEPFTFAGRPVERGEQVGMAMSAAHWLPELYPDPERFDVDRFRPPRNEHRQPGAFAPFGLGPHMCQGNGIAEVQLMAILASVARAVEIEPLPDTVRFVPSETFSAESDQPAVRVIRRRV
jgi:cytochrome P450